MKRHKHQQWLYPNCFFVFFSVFLLVKFICVFFFTAGFEPLVLYHLTPFYLFSGFNNIHLLLLSLVLMVFDLYLHIWSSRRKLLLSFLPTVLMITGIGYTMMFSPVDISYVYHYVLFGLVLSVILIDYQDILKGIQPSTIPRKKDIFTTGRVQRAPSPSKTQHFFAKQDVPVPQPTPIFASDGVAELKKVSDDIIGRMQILLDDLERKTQRLEKIQDFSHEMRNTAPSWVPLSDAPATSQKVHETPLAPQHNLAQTITPEESVILKEKIQNHLIIDEMNGVVAILQRGVFKEISNSFAGFLGYERTELLQKNFFVFIAPGGYEDARKYYLSRLKGATSSSFRTILLTKTKEEVLVEIIMTPTVYKGDSAEFICVTAVNAG